MKIDYTQAKELCTANEFSLLEQCKPQILTKFTEAELKVKIRQARKLNDKWRDQARSQGGASRSGEKEALFAEAVARLERRLALLVAKSTAKTPVVKKPVVKKTVAKKAAVKKPTAAKAKGAPPLSLKRQAKQKSITSGLRMDVSGKNSRVRGHVSAQGRRKQAARQSRNR